MEKHMPPEFHAALEADKAFSLALARQFGSRAGDHRYDRHREGWSAECHLTCDRFMQAQEAWSRILTAHEPRP